MKDFFEELCDEASDFFEDLFELLGKTPPKNPVSKAVILNGAVVMVRPAYLFAERVDAILRLVFGISIVVSAITASILGFPSLSELLKAMLFTVFGRMLMVVIGFSYLLIASWKLLHLRQK